MKNWLNTFPGVMTMIVIILIASEAITSSFLGSTAIIPFISHSETTHEILHTTLEIIMMAPLLYFVVFKRIQDGLERIQKSNKKIEEYLRFFELSIDPMGIADPFGNFKQVNPAFLKLTGYRSEELTSKPFLDFVAHEDREATAKEMERQVALGSSLNFENRYVCKDGSKILLSWNAFHDKESGVTYATARDITEKRALEDKLVRNESHLRTLVRTIPDLIWLKDVNGVYLSCNPMFERFFGKKESEIVGKTDYDFVNKDLADFFRAKDQAAIDAGKPSINEEWITFADDGHRALVETIKTPVYKADSTLLGVLGVARDITTRKENEKKLAEVSGYTRSLIEASLDPLVTISVEGKITDVNKETELATGVNREELIGKDFADYFTEPAKAREGYQKVFAEGKVTDYPLSLIHCDGHITDVLYNASVYRDEDGAVAGVFAAARDITEQKKAAETLKKSEHGLAEAQRIAHLGSWQLDLIKNELSWSEENYRIFGFENAKFGATYEAFLETVHPDDRDMVNKAYTESVETRIPYNIDHRLLMKDGTVKYVNERCETFYDESGKPIRSIGTTYDITEHKLAEQKILRLSSLYVTLSLCNQAIVHSNNREELFMQVCRAAVESGAFDMAWIGLVDNESKTIIPAYSYGDTTDYLKDIRVSTKEDTPYGRGPTGTSVRENRPYWCQDFKHDPNTEAWREAGNRAGWGSSAALPLYEKGLVIGSITLYTTETGGFDDSAKNLLMEMSADISFALDNFINRIERNELEADLTEGKVQDEALLSSLGEGMIAVDTEGKIITMNRMAEKMLGWSEDEVLGKVATDVILAVDDKGGAIPSEKRICLMVANSRGNEPLSCTTYLVKKDGGRIPVIETATPVIIDGKNTGAVIIMRDITQEMELEKTRQDLLSLASHQLRTPLSGTKWLIETLIKGIHGPLTDAQEDYLNELYKINERMTTLVQDMLGVLRMESGTVPVKTTKISTSGVVATLLENFSPAAKSKLIALESEEEADFVVETDQALLQSILDSLISNAITYSPPGKKVLVSTKKVDNKIIFSVKDSGIGIPKDEQRQIYDRFYRASNAKIFNTKGTGLGLYIAATLAKKIGAEISFETEEGKGSIFHVHIPYPSVENLSV